MTKFVLLCRKIFFINIRCADFQRNAFNLSQAISVQTDIFCRLFVNKRIRRRQGRTILVHRCRNPGCPVWNRVRHCFDGIASFPVMNKPWSYCQAYSASLLMNVKKHSAPSFAIILIAVSNCGPQSHLKDRKHPCKTLWVNPHEHVCFFYVAENQRNVTMLSRMLSYKCKRNFPNPSEDQLLQFFYKFFPAAAIVD